MKKLPFWEVIRQLSAKNVVYDVKMMPDGDFRPDDFGPEDVNRYQLLVLPDCNIMTENQTDILEKYAQEGGKILTIFLKSVPVYTVVTVESHG